MYMRGLPADLANSSADECRQATSGADTSGASINFEICFKAFSFLDAGSMRVLAI